MRDCTPKEVWKSTACDSYQKTETFCFYKNINKLIRLFPERRTSLYYILIQLATLFHHHYLLIFVNHHVRLQLEVIGKLHAAVLTYIWVVHDNVHFFRLLLSGTPIYTNLNNNQQTARWYQSCRRPREAFAPGGTYTGWHFRLRHSKFMMQYIMIAFLTAAKLWSSTSFLQLL